MDTKARRQYRRDMHARYGLYDNRSPFNSPSIFQMFLTLTMMLTFVVMVGAMMYRIYIYDMARIKGVKYQYISVEDDDDYWSIISTYKRNGSRIQTQS